MLLFLRHFRAPGRLVWFQWLLLAAVVAATWTLRQSGAPWKGVLGMHLRLGIRLTDAEELHMWLWWGGFWCGIILLLLLLSSPWWTRWATRSSEAEPSSKPESRAAGSVTMRSIVALMCGLALALALRLPRLERTIERDEQDTLRRNIIGFITLDENGRENYEPLDWSTTLWEDAQANNPFLFSILARVSLRAWQSAHGLPAWEVSLPILRLWAIIPGVLSLAALWWWLRLMGKPNAATLAVFLGAVHPMHVDYSVQARGYALVMFFLALALCFAWLGLNKGRWRHWNALAACLFGCLYSTPVSVYYVALLGLMLATTLAIRWLKHFDAAACRSLVRLMVSGLVALAIYLPLVLPAVPQAEGYLDKFKLMTGGPTERSGLAGPWPLNFWSKYAAGIMRPGVDESRDWDDEHMTVSRFLFTRMLPQSPLLFLLVWAVMPVLLVFGAWQLIRFTPHAAPLVLTGIIAPLGAYVGHRIKDIFLYYWYLIYFLPIVIALAAVALDRLARWAREKTGKARIGAIIMLSFLALFFGANSFGVYRFNWMPGRASAPEEFLRGKFRWVTYPDGKTRREPMTTNGDAAAKP
jgi:hypothetical protein